MNTFNLVDEPWIPVRWLDSRQEQPLVSLGQAFRESGSIASLGAAPHERVALLRLLVCAAQAAMGAPEDPERWSGWGSDLSESVPEYLKQWRTRFELFDENTGFLQDPAAKKGNTVPAGKLLPHFATGNNPTLFDHAGREERVFPPASLALALLAFQAFYPLYGAGYKGRGPCVDKNMVHCVLAGTNLAETILLNCLDRETILAVFPQMGRPIWEYDPTDEKDRKSVV